MCCSLGAGHWCCPWTRQAYSSLISAETDTLQDCRWDITGVLDSVSCSSRGVQQSSPTHTAGSCLMQTHLLVGLCSRLQAGVGTTSWASASRFNNPVIHVVSCPRYICSCCVMSCHAVSCYVMLCVLTGVFSQPRLPDRGGHQPPICCCCWPSGYGCAPTACCSIGGFHQGRTRPDNSRC